MRLVLSAATIATLLATGCSTAGPFVTSVTSAGPNRLNVEKCYVELNSFVGYVTNKDCTSVVVQTQ